MNGPLKEQLLGRLDISDTAAIRERQATFVARRHAVRWPLSAVIADIAFGEVRT